VAQRSPETARFSVTTRLADPAIVTVVVRGELDLAHAGELKELLAQHLRRGTKLLLDLSAVTFIDSTGLAAVVMAVNKAREDGGELLLSGDLQPQARRLMELTGVLPLLEPAPRNGFA
jgi:anti-sigma B factor antagonist/stage II sporulation protein AA (anti-sigma F factor antagonist)